jgi:hypothetical protein
MSPTINSYTRDSNNNVNVAREKETQKANGLHALPNIKQEKVQTELLAKDILSELGDKHSERFYQLVASKVPEKVIRKILSEVKQGGAKNPAKVFTYEILIYAERANDKAGGKEIVRERNELIKKMKLKKYYE